MVKVLVTPRSFGKYSQKPYEMLEEAGIEVIRDPNGAILSEEQIKEAIKDVVGIIVGVDPLNRDVLKHATNLRSISKYGVGVDNIDLDYAKEHHIDVSITRGANSDAVADFAFTMMLGVARKLISGDKLCREGDWSKRTTVDVYGKKIGVLGLGDIGKGVALRAKGFNMEVYAYDIHRDNDFIKEHNIRFVPIDEIIRTCDFISIHLPLTSETKHLIDDEALKKMKRNAIIVNTARGGVIDEDALYHALKEGIIYGAGLDVFENEPATDSKLMELDNIIVGSHCAASTEGAVDKMSVIATENLINSLREKGIV